MGILDKVVKASETRSDFIKALIWGPNGSGKSTLCGTAPSPILYAYTEQQGLISFNRVAPGEDTIKISSMVELRQLIKALATTEHGYASICLDSFTEMQNLLIDEVVARKPVDSDKPHKSSKLSIEERLYIHEKSKNMVRAFRDLPMNVILTCLSETTAVGEGDKAQLITQVMLSGKKLPAQIGQFFNLIGFCFKSMSNGEVNHRVLFDGKANIETKGMPGLRRREDPDIAYWHDRAIKGAPPRDEKAPMIAGISRGEVVVYEPEKKEDKGEQQ